MFDFQALIHYHTHNISTNVFSLDSGSLIPRQPSESKTVGLSWQKKQQQPFYAVQMCQSFFFLKHDL